jgi:hypothetical protein
MGVPERAVGPMLLLVVEDWPAGLVALGLDVDALNGVVDDACLLGWRRCVEATAKAIEKLGEAEAACVAGFVRRAPMSVRIVSATPAFRRSPDHLHTPGARAGRDNQQSIDLEVQSSEGAHFETSS